VTNESVMGLTFLTGYILGQHGAQSARLASMAGGHGGPSVEDLLDVQERVDRLILVVDAMWSLLEERGFSDQQLRDRIRQIDGEDGESDGRRTRRPVPCRGCDAMVPVGLPSCQFCGTAVAADQGSPLTGI
jgi:hypothetical protein